MSTRTLCIVVCGAGPAGQVSRLIELAQSAGWGVQLVATTAALTFIDQDALAAQYGVLVRSDYRATHGSGPRSSAAGALIIAPATYNTVNKLATGINDNYALNVAAEAIGRGRPAAVMPFVNAALEARRPFRSAVASLRAEGVHVVLGPDQWEPHQPGEGNSRVDSFPWHIGLTAIS